MKAIIFGANGQDGHYLTDLLLKQNIAVTGVSRSGDFLRTDINDYKAISELVQQLAPDFIFHFAANSTTRHDALFENHKTISTGTLNILEAVKQFSPATKVFISGSALQFKNTGLPITEATPFEARDIYSVSRIQSVYAARYYRSLGLHIYVGYFFNHDSPLRTERHMSKKIAAAAKRIGNGSDEKLEIGDIQVVKEWTFAGDVANAVWTMVNQDKEYECVIGSGVGYSIKDWLIECFSAINRDWQDHVIQKKDFIAEYTQLVANPALIFSLGWRPQKSFHELAQMMMA